MRSYQFWIKHLHLQPHPEGGFFREVYRSNLEVDKNSLPIGYSGNRRLSTSIYYLLRSGDISKLHRLKSDELWYYHFGSSLRIVMIDQEGKRHNSVLGTKLEKAENPQLIIPAGTIFGAEVVEADSFCLMACMVSPGFEFDDFEIFDTEELLQIYPKHTELIKKFS